MGAVIFFPASAKLAGIRIAGPGKARPRSHHLCRELIYDLLGCTDPSIAARTFGIAQTDRKFITVGRTNAAFARRFDFVFKLFFLLCTAASE